MRNSLRAKSLCIILTTLFVFDAKAQIQEPPPPVYQPDGTQWPIHYNPFFPASPVSFNDEVCMPGQICYGACGTVESCGCFVGETLIDMASHGSIPINQLNQGSSVLSVENSELFKKSNPVNSPALIGEVSRLETKHPISVLKLSNGIVLKGTANHPIATSGGFVALGKLKANDQVMTKSGYVSVISVHEEEFSGLVFNLAVSTSGRTQADGGTFYANGVLVGDMTVQSKMR